MRVKAFYARSMAFPFPTASFSPQGLCFLLLHLQAALVLESDAMFEIAHHEDADATAVPCATFDAAVTESSCTPQ